MSPVSCTETAWRPGRGRWRRAPGRHRTAAPPRARPRLAVRGGPTLPGTARGTRRPRSRRSAGPAACGPRRVDRRAGAGGQALPGSAGDPRPAARLSRAGRGARSAGLGAGVGARPDSPGVHRDLRSRQDTADEDALTKRLLVAPDPVHPGILHVRQTASPFARRVVRFRDQCAPTHCSAATTSGSSAAPRPPSRRSGLRRLHPRQGGVAGRRPSTRRRLGGWRR